MTGVGLDDDTVTDAVLNGVDARTGHTEPPVPISLLSAIAEGRPSSPEELDELKDRLHRAKRHLGVSSGVDANDLAQAGWGVVFAADDPDSDDARRALGPLLQMRRTEAGALYREFGGDDGLRAGETGRAFLARHGSGPGPVNPAKGVPYYLLIVGPPTRVSFDAQTDIDVRHAVGRLDLEHVDALAEYAEMVVSRQQSGTAAAKRAVVYATRNRGDVSTQRSARHLATPVANAFTAQLPSWHVDRHIGDAATKDALRDILHDGSPPSLLFTASHGVLLDSGDEAAQRAGQGALVTQEWPGPLSEDRLLTEAELFAATDVSNSAQLGGMIAFLFACYSAGTPTTDEFFAGSGRPPTIAAAPFVARLPQRMLARGAAAVIGHVERAWTWSFRWPGAGATTAVFESVLHALAVGARVGAAVEFLNVRYGEIAAELSEELRQRGYGSQNDDIVAALWTARTDARNFIVLGDPAVRLSIAAS
jgi:hypothetical protein